MYIHRDDAHNLKAPRAVVPLIMDLLRPTSVLDVGCGTGTWLKAFEESGVTDILGVDGDFIDPIMLKVAAEKFIARDLRKPLMLNRKFDLVISLEVAEHIDTTYSRQFVQTLVSHGDVILFSAAIPGQGGQHHVNERWLSEWISLFRDLGFYFYDCLRWKLWENASVDLWYRQNAVIFCKDGHHLQDALQKNSSPYTDIVHPEMFAFYAAQAERARLLEEGKLGLQLSWKSLVNAFREKFK